MLKNIFLIVLLSLTCISQSTGAIRHIKRTRNSNERPQSIFDKATIEKTQKGTKLYLADRVVSLLNVPDVMQATDYTCGPSSLEAVLGYYDLLGDLRQSTIAKLAKTNDQYGTSPENLFNVIRSLGINAQLREGMTIADLQFSIRNNELTIILFQAWADEGTDYKNDWSDGHYVVVIGYDKDYLYFEDPWILGSIGYIPRNEFLERWHDIIGGVRKVSSLGIVVKAPVKDNPVIVKLQ